LLCELNTLFILLFVAETIDQEKKMKHSKLADRLEEVIQDPTKISVKLKVLLNYLNVLLSILYINLS
jgi:hypothetical protein